MQVFDVLVIGAGASGLMAAREVSRGGKSVCVLEARDRIGGRIHTIDDSRFEYPVEAGAEFIHGKLTHTFKVMKEAGLEHYEARGNIQVRKGEWKKENEFIERAEELTTALKGLEQDMSLKKFLLTHFEGAKNRSFRDSVTGFAEGYDAADTTRFSAQAFRLEMESDDDENYRPTAGYTALMEYLWRACEANGCVVKLNNVVKEIKWNQQLVSVVTTEGTVYKARQVVVTIPVGVWQARQGAKGTISFQPDLPEKRKAARHLGFGGVIKVCLQFDEVFWKDHAKKIGFILSDEAIPTWWTQEPDKRAMLNGWVAGPAAMKLKDATDDELLQKAVRSLAEIFKMRPGYLRKRLHGSYVFNWLTDSFARGAYGYHVVGGEKYLNTLGEPVEGRLFFAGEALYHGSEMGTVEAALASGKHVARVVELVDSTKMITGQITNKKGCSFRDSLFSD